MITPEYTSTGLNPAHTKAVDASEEQAIEQLPIKEQIAHWKHRSRAAENRYKKQYKTAKLVAKRDRLLKELSK